MNLLRRFAMLAWVGLLWLPATALAQETVEYYGADSLGSIRVVFDQAGGVIARSDYLPFGEEVFSPGPMPRERFTGQERDGDAGQDYFHARMNIIRHGRFTDIDPAGGRLTNPQTWNLYTYALNNPLSFRDPTGAVTQPDTHCSQTAGAYWCPGSVVFNPIYVPPEDANDFGYHGGEVGLAEAAYNNRVGLVFAQRVANAQLPVIAERGGSAVEQAKLFLSKIVDGITGTVVVGGPESELKPTPKPKLDPKLETLASVLLLSSVFIPTPEGAFVEVMIGHGGRHALEAGLSIEETQAAILQQISEQVAAGATKFSGDFQGRVIVGGKTVQWRGYGLPDGRVNIGTYVIP